VSSKKCILTSILLLVACVSIGAEEPVDNYEMAMHFYKVGEYMDSLKLLSANSEANVLLIWRNEIEIGGKTKYHPNKKLHIEYIEKHPKLFFYYEPGGDYLVTKARLGLLKKLNPKSKYLEEMEYYYIEQEYNISGEFSDDFYQTALELIKIYESFLKKYPNTVYKNKIHERITRFRKVKPATEDCKFKVYGSCVD